MTLGCKTRDLGRSIVGVDCYKLRRSRGKSIGIYNYAKNLVRQLVLIDGRDYEVVVFGNDENREDMAIEGVRFIEFRSPKSKWTDVYWELWRVKKWIRSQKVDLMIYPRGFKPIGNSGNELVVIHDLIPFYYARKYPGYFSRLESAYIRNRLKRAMRDASNVLTISQFSLNEIVDMVGDRERLSCIYNAYEIPAHDEQEAQKEDYILAMTSSLPHKNLSGILKAYEIYSSLGGTRPLRVIGVKESNKWKGTIQDSVYEKIRFIPFLDDEELVRALEGAKYFLFLSEIEGFGYPPIEAMALGTVVISSEGGALKEVVGDGGILVNSPEHAAESILELDNQPGLYKEMLDKGQKNVRRFNQRDYRQAVGKLIDDILSTIHS